jgi:CheY-like chemotaxis protein
MREGMPTQVSGFARPPPSAGYGASIDSDGKGHIVVEQRLQSIQSHLRGIESFRQRALAAGDVSRVARAEQMILHLEQQLVEMQDRLEHQEEQERQEQQAKQDKDDAPSRQHIFVVNGDPDFLNTMRSLLQDERFNVTTTNFVPTTFDQIAALQPALLLVHMVVGERAGWDVLERIQREAVTRAIPVVATSQERGFLERTAAEQERYGPDRFRVVPLDYHTILAAIDDLIGKA